MKKSVARKIADSAAVVDTEINERHMNRTVLMPSQAAVKVDRKSRAYRINKRKDSFMKRPVESTKNADNKNDKRIVFYPDPDTDTTDRVK